MHWSGDLMRPELLRSGRGSPDHQLLSQAAISPPLPLRWCLRPTKLRPYVLPQSPTLCIPVTLVISRHPRNELGRSVHDLGHSATGASVWPGGNFYRVRGNFGPILSLLSHQKTVRVKGGTRVRVCRSLVGRGSRGSRAGIRGRRSLAICSNARGPASCPPAARAAIPRRAAGLSWRPSRAAWPSA